MIRLEPWSTDAEKFLARVDKLDLEDVRADIDSGRSQLWHFFDGDDTHGYAVTRLQKKAHSRKLEWVWVACAGRGFLKYAPMFLDAAHEAGVEVWVMVHNAAMRRLYHRLGFKDYSHTLYNG